MLIISHTDVNHTDTGTLPTKHANIYENRLKRKKKEVICAKKIAKLRPHQMKSLSHTQMRSLTRAVGRQLDCDWSADGRK